MKTIFKTGLMALISTTLIACGGEVKEWDSAAEIDASRLKDLSGSIESGKITVTGLKEQKTIQMQTHFRLQSKGDLTALSEQIQSEVTQSSTTAKIILKQPAQGESSYQLSTDLSLTVPESLALKLRSENGKINVQAMKSALILSTSNGGLEVKDIVGDVDLESNNGSLDFNNVTGHAHKAHTSNGKITLQDVNGPIIADTSNGSIKAHLSGVNRPEKYSLTTSNGSIDINLPQDSSVLIQYTKGVGNIETDFAHKKDESEIMVGKGDATMMVKTGNGKITIHSR